MKNGFMFSFYIGIRNFYTFRKGKKRSMAGAVIAVALSVIPMIVVIEVSDGMIEGITRRFIELETGHIQVAPLDDSARDEIFGLTEQISELPGVIYAAPVYRGTGLIYSSGSRVGIQIKAMSPDIFENDAGFRKYLEIKDGQFDLADPSGIMLSSAISEQLGVKTGDPVKLLTARTLGNGKIVLRPEAFTVKGIFSTGYYEVDSLSGYIGYEKGEKLFRDDGYLSIQCKITDPYNDADSMARTMDESTGYNVSAVTWYGMQRSMYESFHTTRILLVFIMGIIIIVASVNIASSMIIMVIERRSDIAILKSCGAGGPQIRRAFIITGAMTGLAGAAAGTAIGLLVSVNINTVIHVFQAISETAGSLFNRDVGFSIVSASSYYLDEIPVHIEPVQIVIVAFCTVLMAIVAAVLPARKAEKLMPLEIMRKH